MGSLGSVLRRVARAVRFGAYDHRRVFEHIYNTRYWGDRESVSGIGSSLAQTANIRAELPKLIEKFEIKSIFDAPCGDLHWMQDVLKRVDVNYLGADIVPAVVELAASKHTSDRTSFQVFDIVGDTFPEADLWICRDVLFHLSYDNIKKALLNFASSKMKYILVTTHTGPAIINRNVVTGDFRQLDMFKAPFNFPVDAVRYRFEDYAPPHNPRDMVLISRSDLASVSHAR